MCEKEDSKKFQEMMSLYLRSSPIIPPPPEKCPRCDDYHTIGGQMLYCKVCHHPKEEPVSDIEAVKPGIAARLWSRVVG